MLTIEPEGGICNRMRVMHSTIALAHDIKQPVRLLWIRNRDIGCNLNQLLETPAEFQSVTTFSKLNWSGMVKIRYNIQRYCRLDYLKPDFRHEDVMQLLSQGFDFTSLGNRRRTHVKSWQEFYNKNNQFYAFEPALELRPNIEAITSSFRNTIGVHIRRTDHRPSREYSPTSLFKERMQAMIDRDPSVQFYLCSDDPQEVAALQELYGERVKCAPIQLPGRQSTEALQAAIVDLFCLAATRKIIGSFRSTFSDTAARLGNIPLEVVKSQDEPVVRW